ncbi:DUF421 domain-containing protein [Flavobacterium ardleyense]|uniref:DUF421 domain-containing protein n=1 Tax=Flavobacterium ardleyense TaxID=2038737 RepID=UPI00298C0268|nr:YetF domain-containing protein [Flavobacterium ardleyense]
MEALDWHQIFLDDKSFGFLFEVAFRTIVMFTVLLLTLKLTGKRGVRELSVFETVIIIALGSAAGDPMFYDDVAILPALTVFLVVILCYRFLTWLTGKSKRFEEFMEGKTECLIKEGKFVIETFNKESLAQDEFFSELRLQSVSHLGQIEYGYLETTGDMSIIFYDDNSVKYGLPILPHLFLNKTKTISQSGIYACTHCGAVDELSPGIATCKICKKQEWVEAIKTKRNA